MVIKEVLRQVVVQQRGMVYPAEGIVKREAEDEINEWFPDDRIIILTGLRRCGKSTILRQLMKDKTGYCYVNFEDERFIDFMAQEFESLNEVLTEVYGSPKTYFFDEIQNIDKFESFVRRLQDAKNKIVITGSNASLLSKELGTRLTGRYKSFEVYPFSFREYLSFNGISPVKDWPYLTEKKALLQKEFDEYLQIGGLPEYLKNKDLDYIRTVYENILYRDIISRYAVKRQKTLKELANLLASNISCKFTYNSLKKTLGLSNAQTVKEYISYLANSYLFFEVQKYDYSLKKRLASPRKIYLIDPSFSMIAGTNFSGNLGKKLENAVYIELKRKNKEVYYFEGKNECDFLTKEGTKITQAIQVCYVLNEENKERETKGLLEAMETHKLKEGLILTYEQEEEISIANKQIKVTPAWKWMMGCAFGCSTNRS
jgi:uncharacterized protein